MGSALTAKRPLYDGDQEATRAGVLGFTLPEQYGGGAATDVRLTRSSIDELVARNSRSALTAVDAATTRITTSYGGTTKL